MQKGISDSSVYPNKENHYLTRHVMIEYVNANLGDLVRVSVASDNSRVCQGIILLQQPHFQLKNDRLLWFI